MVNRPVKTSRRRPMATFKKGTRKPRKSTKRPRGAFVRKVKQIISSLTESKQAYTTTGDALIQFNSGIDSTGDIRQILPSISQGVADNNRIGDQIRGQNLNVKGHIKLSIQSKDGTTTDGAALPNVMARLMVVSMKTKPNFTEASSSAAPLASLLKKGGTTVGFTGQISDLYAPINRDLFTVHHDKKFYLNQSFVNGIGPSPASSIIAQDIRNTVKFFNFNVKCKKIIKYDEDVSSGLLPTNFGPMLLLGYSYLSGDTPDALYTNLGLCYDSTFTFEDA